MTWIFEETKISLKWPSEFKKQRAQNELNGKVLHGIPIEMIDWFNKINRIFVVACVCAIQPIIFHWTQAYFISSFLSFSLHPMQYDSIITYY